MRKNPIIYASASKLLIDKLLIDLAVRNKRIVGAGRWAVVSNRLTRCQLPRPADAGRGNSLREVIGRVK